MAMTIAMNFSSIFTHHPLKPIPILGIVPAGFASPVDEDLADMLRIEDYIIRDKNASFLLQMQGDSMVRHGICDGDLIIFERGADARPGDLVVALTSDGHRIVFLDKRMEGVEIVGVVVSVVRKYK